ncbi:MAG TPA: sigma factor, partial [Labilithrix sp.]|nr:sigma factor [Labilithrix sp.]
MGSVRYAEVTNRPTSADVETRGVADAAPMVVRELMSDRESFLAFVRGRLRSGADAEDVLQQALLKAAEHAHDLRDSSRARAWFYKILRRVLADHH